MLAGSPLERGRRLLEIGSYELKDLELTSALVLRAQVSRMVSSPVASLTE